MNCAENPSLIHVSGVFALAICLMVLEIPEGELINAGSENSYTIYIPQHDAIYAPIGTVFEVQLKYYYAVK